MIVADASALALALMDIGGDGDRCRRRLRGHRLAAPDFVKVEVLSVVRRHLVRGAIDAQLAEDAVAALTALDMTLYSSVALLAAAWDLRDNLTAYDACYVALAEALECPLITSDARISRAPGLRCVVEVV